MKTTLIPPMAAPGRDEAAAATTTVAPSLPAASDAWATARPWYPIFLKTLAERQQVKAAASAAGVSTCHAWRCRKHDEWFGYQWEVALGRAVADPDRQFAPPQPIPRHTLSLTREQKWYPAFLAAFAELGSVAAAAAAANITADYAYEHRAHNPSFAERWQAAREKALFRLETEAHRRAVQGSRSYKYYAGQPLMHPDRPDEHYYELSYSDKLLLHLLRVNDPERHREQERQREMPQVQENAAPMMDLTTLSTEEQDMLEMLLRKATGRFR